MTDQPEIEAIAAKKPTECDHVVGWTSGDGHGFFGCLNRISEGSTQRVEERFTFCPLCGVTLLQQAE
jgi:hypothetical protein